MPDDNHFYSGDMEDIRSSSGRSAVRTVKKAYKNYGNGIFRNIANIIKAISFIVSIFVLLLFAAAAAVLVVLDRFFIAIAIGLFIVGIIVAAITLFLIYGMGHIISQNDEILRRM